MPTFQALPRFEKDFGALSPEERRAFKNAVKKFVADLKSEDGFRNGLRVKGVQGADGVFEMTWAGDGRATFQFGQSLRDGEPHVIWRRIGSHAVLDRP